MGQRTWREITKIKVPEREGCAWTPVRDYLTPGKMYRVEVLMLAAAGAPNKQPPQDAAPDPNQQPTQDAAPDPNQQLPQEQKWKPESVGECTADGNPTAERSDSLLIAGAAVGALLAKIGGSTADLKPETDKVVLFAVGRHCVFTVDATKAGTLYMGVNDTLQSLVRVQGQLEITLSEAL